MQQNGGILIVDDESSSLTACSLTLRAGGLDPVSTCQDPLAALNLLRAKTFSLLLLDLSMPGMSGEEVLAHVREEKPELPVIIMTAFNDAETAMRCIRGGAYDYLTKPLDKDRLLTTVRRALGARGLRDENIRLKDQLLGNRSAAPDVFASILTSDEGMQTIFKYVCAISESTEPVMITGETGTGKDLMARAIHEHSGRKGEFVALNAAGLDEQMFSDVLFGHTKGAFTGAAAPREGLLQKANAGTLFLDEIGDVPASLQTRLLRVIESGEYYAGGSDRLLQSGARILVATNRDVAALREGGLMRRDLFYRLDVHHIHLPPLRERSGDIRLLSEAFARSAALALNRSVPVFAAETFFLMMRYDWPGNIRELRAVITDAVSSCGESVAPEWLATKLRLDQVDREDHSDPPSVAGHIPTLREATEALVAKAMEQAQGNQSRAARLLGISQPALSKRLKNMQAVI